MSVPLPPPLPTCTDPTCSHKKPIPTYLPTCNLIQPAQQQLTPTYPHSLNGLVDL